MPRMTCTRWMRLANHLPKTPEGNDLYNYIDYRTDGTVWSREKAIAIPKPYQSLYTAALEAVEAEEAAELQQRRDRRIQREAERASDAPR